MTAVPIGEHTRPRRALVLSGGGARGAYQVGVLRGLVAQGFLPRTCRDRLLVGSIAGAINTAAVAAWADDLHEGMARLEQVWSEIHPSQVYRTDVTSLGRIGARWAWVLLRRRHPSRAAEVVADTAPLRTLLGERVDFSRIEANLAQGRVAALVLIATDLHTSTE